jgi:S-formylglutathione hydrolase FrmB
MLRLVVAVLLLALACPLAGAQVFNHVNLDRLNRKLCGKVVDFTNNHGQDRRIDSPILGMKRDLYVYLPPGYDPSTAHPLVLYFHTASVDEHTLIAPGVIETVDAMIAKGEFPPSVVACPDGTYEGVNRFKDPHSLYVNGLGGRFEDHLLVEVLPFLTSHYSIRPEREAHAILGMSAGGYGGMGLALKHREYFAAVATLGGPLNLRYDTADHDRRENFDPATYRWKDQYDPNEVAGVFYGGLKKSRAGKYLGPVYGDNAPEVIPQIIRDNPADLLISTDLKPGELALYVNYPAKDNWNIDAQDQSFAWLASQKGVDVTLVGVPKAKHTLRYFRSQQRPAFTWLAGHLLPPTSVVVGGGARPVVQ